MLANGTRWREESAAGAADLGDGVAAPVVAGKGAIDPFKRSYGRAWGRSPPMLMKGAMWREECAARAAAKGIVLVSGTIFIAFSSGRMTLWQRHLPRANIVGDRWV